MAKAKKLPSGNWRIRVYDKNTGKYLSFTAETKNEAELMALEWKMSNKKKPANRQTVGDCIDDYIKSKENILSPTTIESYRCMSRNSLADLRQYKLSEIEQDIIQKHFNKLAINHSPKTLRNAHGFLMAVLNIYAPDLRIRTTLPQKQKKIKSFPAVEDVIRAVKGTEIELPCMMAIWLGMRMSEVRGAKKSNIHDGVLIIDEVIVTVNGENIVKNQTKTVDSTRRINIPPYIQNLIDQQEGEYLTELSGRAIYKRLSRILEKNGLQHITFHDLRHLNASTMLMLGVPDKYAMERGGWSSTSIMKSVYQHTFTQERQAVDRKIDDYFNDIIEKYDTKHDTHI